MMNRLARALIVLAVGIVVTGRAPGAWACSCVADMSPADHMKHSSQVFEGVAYDRHDPDGGGTVVSSGRMVTWDFDVEKELKGDLARRIEVHTAADGASCGYTFRLGNRYRVYLYDNGDGGYSTGLCSGNEDLGPSGRTIAKGPSGEPPRSTMTPGSADTDPSSTPSAPATPSPSSSIDGVAAGAPVDGGGGSGGFLAGFAAVTLATTVGALLFSRRRRT